MEKIRISAAKTFALEMVRSSLQHNSIPPRYRLNGMWMHMDMEMGDDELKLVSLLISIHGVDNRVYAFCEIKKKDCAWVQGTCKIKLLDDAGEPTQQWDFTCELVDNRLVAIPAFAP